MIRINIYILNRMGPKKCLAVGIYVLGSMSIFPLMIESFENLGNKFESRKGTSNWESLKLLDWLNKAADSVMVKTPPKKS